MGLWMKIVLMAIVVAIAFFAYRKMILEHFTQENLIKSIEAKKFRKENSVFDIKDYIRHKKYYKDKDWLTQKNKGKNPCDLKKKIKLRDYSEGCKHIVFKKGL